MRNITPIQFTNEPILATKLDVTVSHVTDALTSFANFSWSLHSDDGELVNNGVTVCDGDNYTSWDGNENYPYEFGH